MQVMIYGYFQRPNSIELIKWGAIHQVNSDFNKDFFFECVGNVEGNLIAVWYVKYRKVKKEI